MFRDTFELSEKIQARPLTPTEQTFWRIVRMDAELQQLAQTLSARGQFTPIEGSGARYMRYSFPLNGQQRKFEAQITPNTNVIQLKNFFATCNKGLNGIFEQPNIAPYTRVRRRPL
jgi:hypothetical protein